MDITFITGFGCGVCLGISLLAYKKMIGMFSKETSSSKKICEEETTAKEYFRSTDNEYQLVVVVVIRSDLQTTIGELATRCSHVSLVAFEQIIELDPDIQAFWNSIGKPNITLKTDSVDVLKQLHERAKDMGLLTSTMCEKGDSKTVTVLAIGPAQQDILIQLVGHLKLL